MSISIPSHTGQVIAEIDPKLFQGAVLQAQADLQNAQASLTAAKTNLAKDEATLEQNKLDYERARSSEKEQSGVERRGAAKRSSGRRVRFRTWGVESGRRVHDVARKLKKKKV